MAKRIIAAWVEQVIEFDSLEERGKYVDALPERNSGDQDNPNWDIDDDWNYPGVTLRIRKRYNKNRVWRFENEA